MGIRPAHSDEGKELDGIARRTRGNLTQGSTPPAQRGTEEAPMAAATSHPGASAIAKKVRDFDKYSRNGGRWSWGRPAYEREVVSLVKAERKMEEQIASALTEVEAVEAGLRYFDKVIMPRSEGRHEEPKDKEKDLRERSAIGRSNTGHQGENAFDSRTSSRRRPTNQAGRDSASKQAVARCLDLKLSLRQRLDNYDRQRGINVHCKDDTAGAGAASLSADGGAEPIKARADTCRPEATLGGTARAGVRAPCEGRTLERDGVEVILARSLGNAALKNGGGAALASSASSEKRKNCATGSLPIRWQSWQKPPPPALTSSASTARRQQVLDGRGEPRRDRESPRRRAGGVAYGGKASASADSADAPRKGSARSGIECPEGASVPRGGQGQGSRGGTADEPDDKDDTRGSAPFWVPRVAMLAAVKTHAASSPPPARKTKEFDPDKLECVRRHEASVAERARQVRNLRAEAERRSAFRARPLPPFLGGNDAQGTCGDSRGLTQAKPAVTHGAGATRELLAALEQDEEARDLVEKIRKVNPHADIASIVMSSTMPSAPPSAGRCRSGSGGEGTQTSNSAMTPPLPATCLTLEQHANSDVQDGPLNTSALWPEALQRPRKQPRQSTRDVHGDAAGTSDGEDSQDAAGVRDKPREVSQPHGTPEGDTREAETEGYHVGSACRTPRSLMGRMLGSGMLQRQREWANARRRKVMESRRKAAEAKEKEGKEDVLEVGFGERSWANAKTEHSRSLERQRAEDDTREQLREARRRASAARAERERTCAEEKAAALAAKIAATNGEQRESRTAPSSRDGRRLRHKPPAPRRAKSLVEDESANPRPCVSSSVANLNTTGGGQDADLPENLASEPCGRNMSEDDFYRVAVEKIMERESLRRDDIDVGTSGDSGRGQNAVDPARKNRVKRHPNVSQRKRAGTEGMSQRARRRRPLLPPPAARHRRKRATSVGTSPLRRGESGCGSGFDDAQATCSLRDGARNRSLLSLYEAQSVEQFTAGEESALESGSLLAGYDPGNRRIDAGFRDRDARGKDRRYHPGDGKTAAAAGSDAISDHVSLLEEYVWSANIGMGHCASNGSLDNVGARQASDKAQSSGSLRGGLCGVGEGTRVAGDLEDLRQNEPQTSSSHEAHEQHWRLAGQNADAMKAEASSAHTGEDRICRPSSGRQHSGPGLLRDRSGSQALKDQPDEPLAARSDTRKHSLGGAVFDEGRRSWSRLVSDARGRDACAWQATEPGDEKAMTTPSAAAAAMGAATAGTSPWDRPEKDRDQTGPASSAADSGGHQLHRFAPGDDATLCARARVCSTSSEEHLTAGSGERPLDAIERSAQRGCLSSDRDMSPSDQDHCGAICTARLRRPFFDPVTSSADKGRFKVKDPRNFDPCSMRRTPAIVMTSPARAIDGAGDQGPATRGTTAVAAGVTLLLGRALSEDGTQRDEQEQVITVMFDRSKFNEQEAQRWWTLKHARVIAGRS